MDQNREDRAHCQPADVAQKPEVHYERRLSRAFPVEGREHEEDKRDEHARETPPEVLAKRLYQRRDVTETEDRDTEQGDQEDQKRECTRDEFQFKPDLRLLGLRARPPALQNQI